MTRVIFATAHGDHGPGDKEDIDPNEARSLVTRGLVQLDESKAASKATPKPEEAGK